VHPPGSERDLEALHRRERSVDAALSAMEVALRDGDPGAGLPGARLPGTLGGRQGELEKVFGVWPCVRQITLRQPQLGQRHFEHHATVPVMDHRSAIHLASRR